MYRRDFEFLFFSLCIHHVHTDINRIASTVKHIAACLVNFFLSFLSFSFFSSLTLLSYDYFYIVVSVYMYKYFFSHTHFFYSMNLICKILNKLLKKMSINIKIKVSLSYLLNDSLTYTFFLALFIH